MTIDEAIIELSEAASDMGVGFCTQNDCFSVGIYDIDLSVEGDDVHWRIGERVGGRWIGTQSGMFCRGDGRSLIEMIC